MKKFKYIAALLLALTMSAGSALTAYATDGRQETAPEEELIANANKLPVQSNELTGWPQAPATAGQAAIVMEAGTGAVLYAKNIHQKEYPASITKVLTAMVALDNGKLTDPVKVTESCVSFLQPGDSAIGLKEGDEITLDQALHATLLASGNEAAYSVGENVARNSGHDYSWFIQQMNDTCRKLGGVDSHFVNTNGLHDPEHYTSAYDMARIGRALFDYPDYLRITQTLNYKIPASATVEEHVFQQKDKMLIPGNRYYYEPTVAGKTGFTSNARGTLITLAEKDGMKLVCVVLHTYGSNTYVDTTSLLNYGFDNFKKVAAAEFEDSDEIEQVNAADDSSGYVVLPDSVDPKTLTRTVTADPEDKSLVDIAYSYNGLPVGEAKGTPEAADIAAVSSKSSSSQSGQSADGRARKMSVSALLTNLTHREITILGSGVVLLILIGAFAVGYSRHVQRRRRRNRRRKR